MNRLFSVNLESFLATTVFSRTFHFAGIEPVAASDLRIEQCELASSGDWSLLRRYFANCDHFLIKKRIGLPDPSAFL
jgi:hypothetical protein